MNPRSQCRSDDTAGSSHSQKFFKTWGRFFIILSQKSVLLKIFVFNWFLAYFETINPRRLCRTAWVFRYLFRGLQRIFSLFPTAKILDFDWISLSTRPHDIFWTIFDDFNCFLASFWPTNRVSCVCWIALDFVDNFWGNRLKLSVPKLTYIPATALM